MAVADTTELLDDEMIDPVTEEIIDQKDLAKCLLAQADALQHGQVPEQ